MNLDTIRIKNYIYEKKPHQFYPMLTLKIYTYVQGVNHP